MELHSYISVTEPNRSDLFYRLQKGLMPEILEEFEGHLEGDETYVGGLENNKHGDKILNTDRSIIGKSPVLGVKDLKTDKIKAKVIEDSNKLVIQDFVDEVRTEDSHEFTDDHSSYGGLIDHTFINDNHKKWIVSSVLSQIALTNSIGSCWAVIKLAYHGAYHQLSKEYLNHYVTNSQGRIISEMRLLKIRRLWSFGE